LAENSIGNDSEKQEAPLEDGTKRKDSALKRIRNVVCDEEDKKEQSTEKMRHTTQELCAQAAEPSAQRWPDVSEQQSREPLPSAANMVSLGFGLPGQWNISGSNIMVNVYNGPSPKIPSVVSFPPLPTQVSARVAKTRSTLEQRVPIFRLICRSTQEASDEEVL
jgi:hypothetical protein